MLDYLQNNLDLILLALKIFRLQSNVELKVADQTDHL